MRGIQRKDNQINEKIQISNSEITTYYFSIFELRTFNIEIYFMLSLYVQNLLRP